MSGLRRTVLWVTVASFAAGLGTGFALPVAAAALREPPVENPDQQFVRGYLERFTGEYGLRADQVRDLRAILLQFCYDKLRIVTDAGYQQWPPELQSQWVQARRQMDKRIEWILDDEQRARYRREVEAQAPK